MIITQLLGGFGNQLFQYAAARSLAEHLKTDWRLDLSAFERYPLRKYELNKLHIPQKIATRSETRKLIPHSSLLRRIARKLRLPLREQVFQEKNDFCFDPDFFSAPADVYLQGYWQSEQYFQSIRHILREELQLKNPPQGKNLEILSLIQSRTSVSVHVRRGDYINEPQTATRHGTCPPEYYSKAADLIKTRQGKITFFVFSDDPDWCTKHLRLPGETHVISHNPPDHCEEDFRLMSLCEHHIIANSSFSWWGAWLGQNPEKTVIAPRRWLNEDRKISDLFPERWILL